MNWYAIHKATIAYGQSMYLAGRFRESTELGSSVLHSRALALSTQIHARILDMLSALTPPF